MVYAEEKEALRTVGTVGTVGTVVLGYIPCIDTPNTLPLVTQLARGTRRALLGTSL